MPPPNISVIPFEAPFDDDVFPECPVLHGVTVSPKASDEGANKLVSEGCLSAPASSSRKRCDNVSGCTMKQAQRSLCIGTIPMSNATPIVFIVDDDVSVRESLELLIRYEGWQAEMFASADEFLSRPRALVPSCLILDLSLPGLSGLDLQKRIASERTDMPIIFITGYGDVPSTVQAMKAGAAEFLTKPFKDDALLNAVRQAIERSRSALDRDAELQQLRDCYGSLSHREQQVMALVVSGLLNKQVASDLGISEITVKAHRGQMMRKMKASSLPDLVRMAALLGLRHAPKH